MSAERGLKKAILHRKNAMFFKTANGAHVGDIFMSLIHTCELAGEDPFDYLTELQRHAEEVSENPKDWMPWNYRGDHGTQPGRSIGIGWIWGETHALTPSSKSLNPTLTTGG